MQFDELTGRQAGVVARRQLVELGWTVNDVRRALRRRDLNRLHPGVYVDHTGPPSWLQRAWGGVLACEPAALAGASALRAAEGPGRRDADERLVEVAVGRDRHVVAPRGVVVRRVVDLDERALWNTGPPRMRYEDAALDVALAEPRQLDAIAALARAVQSRRTTAGRMRASLDARTRAPRRAWVAAVLDDVAAGTHSVLEHGFLARVERPHSLPRARRQRADGSPTGVVYRDTTYGAFIVELDGRLDHDSAQGRDADLERDLDAAVAGQESIRLGWGQVFDRPCSTAAKVSRLLELRGWPAGRPCGPGCALAISA